jgi:uncharacterized protein
MGLIKLILLLVLAVIVYRLWRQMKTAQADKRRSTSPPPAPRMVRCAQCQLHLPENLALRQDDRWYCSSEHRDVDQHL